jgi:glutathione S-transferase
MLDAALQTRTIRSSVYQHISLLIHPLLFYTSSTSSAKKSNMALKLYGVAASTCTKRVLTTLVEKNVPYELVTINVAGAEHKGPEHLKRQPFGKVPALEDDGFIVFESRAICKYIAKKYAGQGTKLIPEDGDLKGYGLFEQVG